MPETDDKKPKSRRLTKYLLIGSLALNLVIIGVVGGAVIGFKRDGGDHRPSQRFGAPHVMALSFEDRRAVGKAIRKAYRNADVDYHGAKSGYQQAVNLLRAVPFDPTEMTAVVADLDLANATRRQVARDTLMQQIKAMTEAERLAYADRLEAVLERGHDRRKHKKSHD